MAIATMVHTDRGDGILVIGISHDQGSINVRLAEPQLRLLMLQLRAALDRLKEMKQAG